MGNREKKTENQVALFDTIKKALPERDALPHVISDLLGIVLDGAYRRIRGDTPISFDEALKLCQHFNISLGSLANVATRTNFIECRYSPLDLTALKDFMTFVEVAADNFEETRLAPEGEIILTAIDVPIFHLLPYRELTLFKIFSWNQSIYGYEADFDTFLKESGSNEILAMNYERIKGNYQFIPSTEIWTANTMDVILKLLSHHSELRHFSDKKTLLSLCEQLLDLMDTLQNWVEKGIKGANGAPFKFKISETDIANTFILFKMAERCVCYVKLYSINVLSTSDERFCQETESWLRAIARRSTLISGASEVDRFKFFDGQRQKIQSLIDKIQSG